jgi:type II secretory ATPase GspE/PulE/Tfp pilus assembly ATPase PilB-like protein
MTRLVSGEKSIEVMSSPDGEVPAGGELGGGTIALADGRLIFHERLRGHPDVPGYIYRVQVYLETEGRPETLRVRYIDDRSYSGLAAKVRSEKDDSADLSDLMDSGGEDSSSSGSDPDGSAPAVDESGKPSDSPGHPVHVKNPEKEDNAIRCLSSPGASGQGPEQILAAAASIAQSVLLMSNGQFYVSREHRTNQHVNYYARHFVPEVWPKIFPDIVLHPAKFVPYEVLQKIRKDTFPEEEGDGFKADGDEGRKVMEIIRDAISRKASDIHIRIEKNSTRILYRTNGWLRPMQTLTHEEGGRMARIIYNTMLDSSGRDNMFSDKKPQDGQFRQDYLPRGVFNIREFHAPTLGSGLGTITMVLRLQYGSGTSQVTVENIGTLGYSEKQLSTLRYLIGLSHGIILFAGPMGSGKSTSMAAVLTIVLSMNPVDEGRGIHLATLEDPPEYVIPTASQIAVPGGKFSEVLGRIMRFDANALMIGEIRDEATAEKAIEGAMSGHVVYSTVHANDVLSIPRRLDGLRVRRDLLADPTIFRGMVCQRLLPVLCPDCRMTFEEASGTGAVPPDLIARIEAVDIDPETARFARHGGCQNCESTGIVGRTIVAEMLVPDQEILDMVASGRMKEAWRYYLDTLGESTMMDHAIEKIREGLADPRNVETRLGWLHKGYLDHDSVKTIVGGLRWEG